MRICIFLHGTLIMHRNAKNKPRKERVRQSLKREPSVLDYKNYIPIGNAVRKVTNWKNQGAKIIYLSSHQDVSDVRKDKTVLKNYKFPNGRIVFRKSGKQYKDIAEKIMPDILIEDDCESIGGKKEMTITNVNPIIKNKIKSIIIKEFSGIDNLPDKLDELMSLCK